MNLVSRPSGLLFDFALVLMVVAALGQNANADQEIPGDGYCGARSVHFLLHLSGVKKSLLDVAKEMHDPNAPGASVAMVEKSLQVNGFKCRSIAVSSILDLRDYTPCIILLANNGASDGLGHFQVLLEVATDDVRVWDGLGGLKVIASDDFRVPDIQAAVIVQSKEDLHNESSLRWIGYAIGIGVAVLLAAVSGWTVMR